MALKFDELANRFLEGGLKAANAAKEAAGIAKLTADAKAEEIRMLDTYKEIGKLFCEKMEGEVDPEFIPLLKKIEDSKAKIAALNKEKERMKAGNPEEAETVKDAEDAEEEAADVDAAEVVEEAAEAVEKAVEEASAAVDEVVAEAAEAVEKAVETVTEAATEVVEEVAECAEEAAEEVKEDIFAE